MIALSPESVLDRIIRAPKSWLILSYEGTLAEGAPQTNGGTPDHSLANLLTDLVRRPAISVLVLSNGQLNDLRAVLPVPGLWLAGSLGSEWDIPEEEDVPASAIWRTDASPPEAQAAGQEQVIRSLAETQAQGDELLVFVGNEEAHGSENAIQAVHDHGGIAVLVGEISTPAQADCRFESPAQVHKWLKQIILKVPPVRL